MLTAAVLSLGLFGHHPGPPRAGLGPWRITSHADRFAATHACAIAAPGVSLRDQVLIFRVASGGDMGRAVFRVDGGPPHTVASVDDAVEVRGFFPQRGWIVDPAGGEVALPVEAVGDAAVVTVEARPGARPRRFRVAGLARAIAMARAEGCEPIAP